MTGPAHRRPRWRELARGWLARQDPALWLLAADLAASLATLAIAARIAAAFGLL